MAKIDSIVSFPIPAPAEGAAPGARAEALRLTAGQTVDVVVEAVQNAIARIRVEGRVLEARTEIALIPGARMRMIVVAAGAEIVLRPAGDTGAPDVVSRPAGETTARQAIPPLPPATSSQAAAEVSDVLAQVQTILRQMEARGGLTPEEAEYIRRLAQVFAQVSSAALPNAENARRAILAYNQPVEAALARIAAGNSAPSYVPSSSDVKALLSAVRQLLDAKSQSATPVLIAGASASVREMTAPDLGRLVSPVADALIAPASARAAMPEQPSRMRIDAPPNLPRESAPANLPSTRTPPQATPPGIAANRQAAQPSGENASLQNVALSQLARAFGVTLPAEAAVILESSLLNGTPIAYDAALSRFAGLFTVPAPEAGGSVPFTAASPLVPKMPQSDRTAMAPARELAAQTASASTSGVLGANAPGIASAALAPGAATRAMVYGLLRELFPGARPEKLMVAMTAIATTTKSMATGTARTAKTQTTPPTEKAPAFPASPAPSAPQTAKAPAALGDLQREGLRAALAEAFPQEMSKPRFAKAAIQVIEARVFAGAQEVTGPAVPELPKAYAPQRTFQSQAASGSGALPGATASPEALTANSPQAVFRSPIAGALQSAISAASVPDAVNLTDTHEPLNLPATPKPQTAISVPAITSTKPPISPAQTGDLLATLDRSVSTQTVSQILKDPAVTPQKLLYIMMTAPRLAALSLLNGEVSRLNLAPSEMQWMEQRQASQVQGMFPPSAETAPSFIHAPIAPEADFIMALKALSQSATVVETPLIQLIKAAQTAIADIAAKSEAQKTLPPFAQQLQRAWEALAQEKAPLSRAMAGQALAAIHQDETMLAAMHGQDRASTAPSQDALRAGSVLPNLWLPMLFESRLITAPWALAPRMPAGWAEALLGLISRSDPESGGAIKSAAAGALGAVLGSGAATDANAGAVSRSMPQLGPLASGTAQQMLVQGLLPLPVAQELAQVILAMRGAPHRRWQSPVRQALASLGSATQEWETDVFAQMQRQEATVRSTLERLTNRFGELSDLLDGQRLQNARAFESGQPMTLWLPFIMDGRQGQARIDWRGEAGERRGAAQRSGYNILLALDLTHTGPLQFHCHIWQRRVSLEVASADARLLEIARLHGAKLRGNLIAQGFRVEKMAFTQALVNMEEPSPLSLAAARPLSVNA